MSKINAIRLINLNYNNNSIHVSDEQFHLGGKDTLLTLQNGGGKSVLVQMLISLFVHKKYRNAEKRPFADYFTSSAPTFLMTEWRLDHEAGYVLTGMMVRKSQHGADDDTEREEIRDLDMITFVSEYASRSGADLESIDVIRRDRKGMSVKSFRDCMTLFESWKRDKNLKFSYYDMNNASQQRLYFEKISEFGIHYREWESIIKKINLRESGLSDLFTNARDERGLLEKWFLQTIEDKLNRENDHIRQFEEMMNRFVSLHYHNREKLKQKDSIDHFAALADGVEDRAESALAAEKEKEAHEYRIAAFLKALRDAIGESRARQQACEEDIAAAREDIRNSLYEQISFELYRKEDDLSKHANEQQILKLELENNEREKDANTRGKNIQICARGYEEVKAARRSLLEAVEKFEASRRKDAETEPLRRELGSALYRYYLSEIGISREEIGKLGKELAEKEDKLKRIASEKEEVITLRNGISARIGALKEKLSAFVREEERFNRTCESTLQRNLFGEYPAGTLELMLDEFEKGAASARNELKRLTKEEEERRTAQHLINRRIQEIGNEAAANEALIERLENEKTRQEEILAERRDILKLLELPEDTLFNEEEILRVCERRLEEINSSAFRLKKSKEEQEKEIRKLREGELTEIPETLTDELNKQGISFIPGLKWLQKNEYDGETNRRLLSRLPFLPYSLLMQEKEIAALNTLQTKQAMTMPLPLISRETLGRISSEIASSAGQDADGTINRISRANDISFYLYFDGMLLEASGLEEALSEMENRVAETDEQIMRRDEEQRFYTDKRVALLSGKLSLAEYRKTETDLNEAKEEAEQILLREEKAREEQTENEAALTACVMALRKAEKTVNRMEQCASETKEFIKVYESYRKDAAEKEAEENREKEEAEHYSRLLSREEKTGAHIIQLKEAIREKEACLAEQEKSLSGYESFAEDASSLTETVSAEEASGMEAKYRAITDEFTREEKQLKEDVEREQKRVMSAEKLLKGDEKRYNLTEEDYREVSYNAAVLDGLEEETGRLRALENGLRERLRQENDAVTRLEEQIRTERKTLTEKTGFGELMPREDIVPRDYAGEIRQTEVRLKKYNERLEALKEETAHLTENESALAEYDELPFREGYEPDLVFEGAGREAVRKARGEMLRDYEEIKEAVRNEQESLYKLLNEMARDRLLQDPFFLQPIEAMLRMGDHTEDVLQQMRTTREAYASLLEKIMVDINMVEDERARVLELLLEYVRKVHSDLNRIDKNATIEIRNRPVKMLRIKTPDWEENSGYYQNKMRDYLEELTKRGEEILTEGGNLPEYLSTHVTTKQLYDAAVGIGTVEIRLYKIEAHREIQITWSEAARNSGGEGFLSAFVILSSLMDYMRRDENDLFTGRQEGKVLIMDNPYAQTTASHLLKPLMQMAAKTNTQLISLTGIGGEAIYNGFDNIYVLNLVSSKMHRGRQYLHADHIRGDAGEVMVSSRILVDDGQMELEF